MYEIVTFYIKFYNYMFYIFKTFLKYLELA